MEPILRQAPQMTGDLRSAFQAYREGLVHSWSQTLSVLAFSLNALFLLLDAVIVPHELLGRFAGYRAFVTGAMLVQYFILRRTRPGRWSILPGYVATVLFAVMISQMTVDLGGFGSPYYAGLNLVIVGVDVLLPWRPIHSLLNGLAVLATYLFMNWVLGGAFDLSAVVSNIYFMGSTVVIAVASSHVRHRLIANEFALRAELVQTNSDHDRSRLELNAARDAHCVESGLVMMMTQTSIMSLVHENPRMSPAEVFHAVNDVLLENISRLRAARYMTLNVVRLGERGLTLAGKHQDVLVWRAAARRVETVVNQGCWIGVVEDTRGHVVDEMIAMDEGDVALFFTDGATEAMNAAGEMFGEDRLAGALADVAERPLVDALEALFTRISAFRA